jgi:hypothetical protein
LKKNLNEKSIDSVPLILGDVQLSPNAARVHIESHDYPKDGKSAIDFSEIGLKR